MINNAIRERRLSQLQAARLLQIPQPKVSALANYHLEGFSVQRLLTILNGLGRDVVIQVRQKRSPELLGRTIVSAA
jgi:predicted XRE-type DNA-binding protein